MRPRDVPGYEQARLAGLLPVVPTNPPKSLPGLSAAARCAALVVVFAGTIAVLLVVTGTSAATPFDVVLGVMAGALLVAALIGASMNRRHVAEAAAGYFTLPARTGLAPVSSPADLLRRRARVPWDYSSLWALSITGAVQRSPSTRVDPPGYYPSPTRAEQMEYWTGAAWTNTFRSR